MKGVKVRSVKRDEVEELLKLILKPTEQQNLDFFRAQMYRHFRPERIVLVAELKNIPTGYLLAQRLTDTLEIDKLIVAPEYRRKGIGTTLFSEAVARLPTSRIEAVARASEVTKAFAEKQGLDVTQVGEVYLIQGQNDTRRT